MKNRWRSNLITVCICVVTLLTVVPVFAQQNAHAEITLRYSTWGVISPEKLAIVDKFREIHPEINIEYIPRNTIEELIAQMWSTDPPDVLDIHYAQNIDWVYANQWIRPIDDLVERDGFDIERFIPDTLRFAYHEGKLMGFPRSSNSSSLGTNYPTYNRTLFNEGGVAFPEEGWTFDDLAIIAKKLTRTAGDGTVSQYGISLEQARENFHLWVWSAGGDILSEDERSSMLLEEKAIDGLQFLVDLVHVHGAMTPVGVPTRFLGHPPSAIRPHASTTGAMGTWPDNYPDVDWSFAPMPRGANSDSGYAQIGSHVVGISSSTEHVEAAWKFLKFLSSKEYQEFEYYELGLGTPHLLDLAREPRFLFLDRPPWNIEPIVNANARLSPRTSVWAEYRTEVTRLLSAAMRGGDNIRTLIEANIDRLNAMLRSVDN